MVIMDLAPVYILAGEETLLKEHALARIKNKCIPPNNQTLLSFNYVSLDGKTVSASRIIDECQQLPVMNPVRCVVVKDADASVINDDLVSYIINPAKNTCLVLLADNLDKRLNIYNKLKKHTVIQEFSHPKNKELIDVIKQYIHSHQKKISSKNAAFIANSLENNLCGIIQELDKLISYTGQRADIIDKDIEAIISENKLTDGFILSQAIQSKDTPAAITLINNLIDQGKRAPEIIGIIRWMLTRIWQGKELSRSKDRQAVSRELRIHPYYLNKFMEQATCFKYSELRRGLINILAIEKLMRTYSIPTRLILELLVIKLTEQETVPVNH